MPSVFLALGSRLLAKGAEMVAIPFRTGTWSDGGVVCLRCSFLHTAGEVWARLHEGNRPGRALYDHNLPPFPCEESHPCSGHTSMSFQAEFSSSTPKFLSP